MKVLHVIPSISPLDGGPSFALSLMARGLSRSGVQVDIATTMGKKERSCVGARSDQKETQGDVNYFYFPRQTGFYKVSLPMKRWLLRNASRYDLIHIHALFSYASCAAARVAYQQRVPYIVRPLGVLNRWGMANRRRLLKRASFRLIERKILSNAAAIHYTSGQEKLEADELGVTTDSVVIPLGIDISELELLPDPKAFHERYPDARGRDIILFLSRLDPKKGIDLLLRAFAELKQRQSKAMLVIAGGGGDQFVSGLKELAAQLNIEKQVIWAGFLSGDEKLAALAAASVFALPSYSENFGIAVAEALAAGLPCVVSDQVGIAPEVERFEAGAVVACQEKALASALERLLTDKALSDGMAANARRLARERFSVEAMTGSLVDLYRSVLTQQAALAEGVS